MTDDLNPSDMLAVKYEYLSRMSSTSSMKRTQVGTLYLLTLGAFFMAIFSAQSGQFASQTITLAMSGLFLLLSAYAALMLVQLIRMRQTWYTNANALYQLKATVIEHFRQTDRQGALVATETTIPKKFEPWSLSFLSALQTGLVGSALIAGAVLFLGLALAGKIEVWMWVIALFVAFIYFVDLIIIYWWLLRDRE
jgi:sensor c-di-GMP phosphodiesterase-like protein